MKWFRYYHDALDDPKVQRLPGDTFKFWINTLSLASRSAERGVISMSIEDIAFDMRLSDESAASMMAELILRGLVEETTDGYEIHNWDKRQYKSDNVTERVTKHREIKKTEDETLHETLHATPGETLKPSVNTDTQINRVTEGQNKEGATAPAPTPEPAKPKAKPKTKLTPIPDDFGISERLVKWAGEKGFTIPQLESQLELFRNNAVMKQHRYADWDAAFQNWVHRSNTWGQLPPADNTLTVHRGGNTKPNPGKRGYTSAELIAMSKQERTG